MNINMTLCSRLTRLILICGLFITTIQPSVSLAGWYKKQQAVMGTVIRVELWHENPLLAQQGIDAIMREMKRIDRLMSPYIKTSELSIVNRDAAIKPVTISDELFKLIKRSLYFSRLTSGAFDITFASVGQFYNFRKKVRPSTKVIRKNLEKINFKHLILNEKNKTLFFAVAGVKIDLGGIAKGHAVDNSIRILKQKGIKHAIVTAGGDSRIIGDRRGRPWVIGIRDPRKARTMRGALPLINTAVSTSGDYERYFVENGEHFHHILNPKTGTSARELRSVTVLAADATTTDALSTSIFILGQKKGLMLIEKLANTEAILINQKNQLIFSSGLLTQERK